MVLPVVVASRLEDGHWRAQSEASFFARSPGKDSSPLSKRWIADDGRASVGRDGARVTSCRMYDDMLGDWVMFVPRSP
jgi:hypothetical protein